MKSAPVSGPHTQQAAQASTASISRQGQRSETRRVTREGRIEADRALNSLFRNYDARSAVDLYLEKYPEYRPAAFRASGRKTKETARERRENVKSWLYRLWEMQRLGLIDLRFYSLHHTHLGLPAECADYRWFFDEKNLKRWRKALEAAFPGAPMKWFFHVGRDNRIHVHLFTDHRCCIAPKIKAAAQGKRRVAILIRDEKTLLEKTAYAHKSPMHWPTPAHPNREQVYMWAAAVEDKTLRGDTRLPQTSGAKNIPKLEAILEAGMNTSYSPGDSVTSAVWWQARTSFATYLDGNNSHRPTELCARHYLKNFPKCSPDLFLQHGLPLDQDTLTDYLDLGRTLATLEPIDNFFGKSSLRHLALFNDFRFDPKAFDRKFKRKQRYRKGVETLYL